LLNGCPLSWFLAVGTPNCEMLFKLNLLFFYVVKSRPIWTTTMSSQDINTINTTATIIVFGNSSLNDGKDAGQNK
jgi:hypothetical protein